MTATAWTLNTAWMLKCGVEAARFRRSIRRVAEIQTLMLLQTLRANCDTEFGRSHSFGKINDARAYQERVPLATYDDFAARIGRIAAGELATEGFVSFPLIGRSGCALALRSHFMEFEELDGGHCRLAHELDRGGRYRVVLTTTGGLYRYQLRDEVDVVGFHHQCPLIRFVGRSDATSDLVGEKLAEPHVRAVLDRLFTVHALQPRFAVLVPVVQRPPFHRLYLQVPEITSDSPLVGSLRDGLEDGLMENPYYRQALAIGQLAAVEVTALDAAGDSAWVLYERRCLQEGQKCGSIKPMALNRRTGWPEVFECRCPPRPVVPVGRGSR